MLDAEKLHHQVMKTQKGLHKCKDDPMDYAIRALDA